VEDLYGVSYGIKMLSKKGIVPEGYFDYVLPPLEGLWWVTHGTEFDFFQRENWVWTLMVRQPDFVTAELVVDVVAKKKLNNPDTVRFLQFREGLSVQVMHLDPMQMNLQLWLNWNSILGKMDMSFLVNITRFTWVILGRLNQKR